MEFLRDHVFDEKFEMYDREPLLRVGRWGISGTIMLHPVFIGQMLLLVVVTQLLCAVAAVVAYYGIVQRENWYQQRRDSIQSVLLGYGVLLPLLLCTPYWLIKTLDVRHCLLLINMVGSPVLAAVRLHEILLAREIPTFARKNVWLFTLYFAVPIVLDHDNVKPARVTPAQLKRRVIKMVSLFLQATLFLNLLSAFNYKIFPSRPISYWFDLLYWGNIGNNFVAASLVSVTLDLGCTFGEVALSLVTGGLHFVKSHDSPITSSTSVSVFWGRRWNRLVSTSLKRGVYGPLRRILPKAAAAILTFLTSGFAHEYMLFVLASARGPHVVANNLLRQAYHHKLGYQFTFFLWNGLLLFLEDCWRGHWSQLLVKNSLPRPLRTTLIMLLVLPITHLFTDEYDECGIFRDIETAFPRIRFIPNSTPLLSHPVLDCLIIQGHNWTRNWLDGSMDDSPWDDLNASSVVNTAVIELIKHST